MAKKDKLTELRQRSRFAAMEGLRPTGGFPIAPRKAVAKARKASKKTLYPVPPYAGVNLLQLYNWAQYEWWQLGRWQRVALPVVVLVALLTWEKERALQEAAWHEAAKREARREIRERYGLTARHRRKRKLLGIIPLPGRG